MSDCSVPMNKPDAGETISMLNERNRRLCILTRNMLHYLIEMSLKCEYEAREIRKQAKNFKREMTELGVS